MRITKKILMESPTNNISKKYKKGEFETYHSTLKDIVNEIEDYVKRNGYELDVNENSFKYLNGYSDIDIFDEGTTQKLHMSLIKNGKRMNKMLHVSIYHMGYSGDKHLELNIYIN